MFTAKDGVSYLIDPFGTPMHSWVGPDPDFPTLAGIEPNTPDGIWGEDANEVFNQLTVGRNFAAKVINIAHEYIEGLRKQNLAKAG